MQYPTKIIANEAIKKVKSWQDDLLDIIKRKININNFDEDLQLSDIVKTEILIDFEEIYPNIYGLVCQLEFDECKTFNEMVGLIKQYM